MQYDFQYIQKITNFSKRKRVDLHRYYSRLPEEEKIRTFKFQMKLTRTSQSKCVQNKEAEFHYSMFLLAVNKIHSFEFATSEKKYELKDIELDQIRHIRSSRIKSLKKKKPSKLLTKVEIQFLELIRRLRGENFSWRDISFYIEKYHKTKISHAYLSKIYQEVEAHKK